MSEYHNFVTSYTAIWLGFILVLTGIVLVYFSSKGEK